MTTHTMPAWVVERPGPIDDHPLVLVEREIPEPGPGEIRVRISTCGVCRTDLHLAEGDLPPRRHAVTPGHEVVGVVDRLGGGTDHFAEGDRVGIPWLAHTCGACSFCTSGRENLCIAPRFTGWDIDGGYAAYLVADARYAYALPAGFGASAHLVAQVAIAEGLRVHVLTRSVDAQQLALALGATSAAGAADPPPEPLDAALLFAPVGTLVPPALVALDRGGTLAIAGIYLTDIPTLDYERHLFQERTLRSVTANTRADGRALLETAARVGIAVTTTPYPFEQANAALRDLAHDRVSGAAVLVMPEHP